MDKLESPILMATIGAAQGVRGEVRVRSYTDEPMELGEYGRLQAADGREFEILEIRQAKSCVVVRFRGVNDRTAAEALNGTELFVEREVLPDEELEEDEFFYADLEGLEAIDGEGTSYGTVTGIYDFGGGDLLELKGPGRRPVVIPFSEAAVLEIDFQNARIIVDPVAAGLAEENNSGPGSRRRRPPKGRTGAKKDDGP